MYNPYQPINPMNQFQTNNNPFYNTNYNYNQCC